MGNLIKQMVYGEQEKAQVAKAEEVTIFDKIVKGEIPAEILFYDEKVIAFKDAFPVAPKHFLVIPKNRDGLTGISKAEDHHESLLGHIMIVGAKVAKEQGMTDGYRVVINEGKEGCQSVYHLHVHFIGGKQLTWPPGV